MFQRLEFIISRPNPSFQYRAPCFIDIGHWTAQNLSMTGSTANEGNPKGASMGKAKKVFVSYARRDEAAAQSLIEELRRDNFSVSGGEGDFKTDVDWQKTAEAAIRSADAVIVIVASNAPPTKYQELEWSVILESHWDDPKKLLIPVLIGDAKLPSFLARFQALRLPQGSGNWRPVIEALQGQAAEPKPMTPKDTAQLKERLKSVETFAQSIKKDENVW